MVGSLHIFFCVSGMEKRDKKSLVVSDSEQDSQSVGEVSPADDEDLIPYHTKQAALAMLYLLFFSALMFTMPFAAFYGIRHLLHEYFQIDGFENTCWSVLASVITVNLVIALYAIFGFMDARKEEEIVNEHARSKPKTN